MDNIFYLQIIQTVLLVGSLVGFLLRNETRITRLETIVERMDREGRGRE